ncbi:histidine triad nucleotide-binding protein [Ligaoa zhengdingensis]|uniref:histidine triad nucleotide-binding protein n=1 Tax=Ligaoa zhengdingensis TaxID=2763658 RepID=UPI0031BA52A5
MDCLFCKIAAGEIPSKKLYEDDQVLAFYDIDPQAPVHFLVIPKQHIPSADALTGENSAVVAHVFEVVAKLAAELGLKNGYRVVNNCGADGGQTVGHLHFHVLGGVAMGWPPFPGNDPKD